MSLITELKIPPTTSYPKLKEFILSNKQPWHLDYYCGENLNDKNDVWDDLEMAWDDLEGMTQHMMEIVKLQSRIAILEKTLEFTRKDGM